MAQATYDREEKGQRCSVHRVQSTMTSCVPHVVSQVSAFSPKLEAEGLNSIRLTKALKDPAYVTRSLFPS
jgi:hypothetical protein